MTMRVDYFMSLLCSITYVTIPSGYLTVRHGKSPFLNIFNR